ncbi:hypothetical protein HJFPF1_06746 [Paramyrothecium foliicola]|nr:hypothetical protein HJFPF1_06746 [Paramyrothecium foliicola]
MSVNLALVYPNSAALPATHRAASSTEHYRDEASRGMDDLNRRRRQNEQAILHTSNPRFPMPDQSQQSRSMNSNAADRYRPAPPSTQSPSTPRGMGTSGSYSGYYQEPTATFSATANMPPSAMGYGSDYSQDARQQPQGFGGYSTATMMYNVPQGSAQGSVYDTQQFGQRQPSTMQLLTPDVTSTYFNSETASGSTSTLPPASHNTNPSSNVFHQTPPSMNYASSSIPSVSGMQQTPGSADVSMTEENEYVDGALEEKWVNYQRQLGTIFQDISSGALEAASETLLGISTWLLTQVKDLGLSLDDASLHADRIKLWNDFNHAWLALGHRQRELMCSEQQPSRNRRIMSEETIKKLGNELVRLCDGIECHGLVDYQYGVWEDQIESILEECLDLFEEQGDNSSKSR